MSCLFLKTFKAAAISLPDFSHQTSPNPFSIIGTLVTLRSCFFTFLITFFRTTFS
jgi:hypothetical protein